MLRGEQGVALQQVRMLFEVGTIGGLTDGQLLEEFESPVAGLPKSFWLILDFRAAQTKGVYVSFDTTTGGKFSRIGLPGMPSSEVNFGGDWMIQAIIAE